MDLQNSVNDIWYRLGFLSLVELNAGAGWTNPTDLFQWLDECAEKLAYEVGLFVETDASIPVVSGTAVYGLPDSHVFTLLAALLDGSGNYSLLRMTSVRDLWALDGNWQITQGTPNRASLDANAVGSITLYPDPTSSWRLFQVLQEVPNTIEAGSPTINLPTPLQDMFSYYVLGQARAQESEQADIAVAAHHMQRFQMYLDVCRQYFGVGQ